MTFTLHTLCLGPHPHTSAVVQATASDLLSLSIERTWKRNDDRNSVAAARSCVARTRRGVVLPIFLPCRMHVNSE